MFGVMVCVINWIFGYLDTAFTWMLYCEGEHASPAPTETVGTIDDTHGWTFFCPRPFF